MDGIDVSNFQPLDTYSVPDSGYDFASVLDQVRSEQFQTQPAIQDVADEQPEVTPNTQTAGASSSGIPDPNGVVPGGPWTEAGAGQRDGAFYGPQQPGGRAMTQWVPPQSEGGSTGSVGYWKTKTPTTPWTRFDQSGTPVTPEQAHPNPPPASTKTEAPIPIPAGLVPDVPAVPEMPEVPELPFILPP